MFKFIEILHIVNARVKTWYLKIINYSLRILMNWIIILYWLLECCKSDIKPISKKLIIMCSCGHSNSQGSSVSIVTSYGIDNQGSRVQFLVGAGNFSLCHCVQTSSGAHPASYPMGTWGSFPRGKVARVWSWPLTSF
jgi:hypothetical protein